jgi:anti-sigma-K factor RskA
MKLAAHKALDALIGEYACGALRAPVRRRFERALREELYVSQRLDYWLSRAQIKPSAFGAIEPSSQVWEAIARDLDLPSYVRSASERKSTLVNKNHTASFFARWFNWRGIALSGAAAILLMIALQWFLPALITPNFETVAQLTATAPTHAGSIVASRSKDGRRLSLKPDRALPVTDQQSFELWLLPKDGSAPVSVAVINGFDANAREVVIPIALANRVTTGAKLAISVEPRGGSKTGAPTGPVILVGAIES